MIDKKYKNIFVIIIYIFSLLFTATLMNIIDTPHNYIKTDYDIYNFYLVLYSILITSLFSFLIFIIYSDDKK